MTAWFGAALAACSGDGLAEVHPDARVCQSADDLVCLSPLDLGPFRVGETHAAEVWVRNVGTGRLHLAGVEVLDGAGVTVGAVPAEVPARGVAPLPLSLSLAAEGQHRARLALRSDDPDAPRLEFEILFVGITPVLVICPSEGLAASPQGCATAVTVDLGLVRPTQTQDAVLWAKNVGNADLALQAAVLDDESTTAGELRLVTSTASGVLPAGGESRIVARYQPVDGLPDRLGVQLVPADAAVLPATLELVAATPANAPPLAVAVELISGATTVVGETDLGLWLDGRASSDPEGDPLAFSWSVVAAPAGSLAVPAPIAATLTRFVPDRWGEFTVQLQVADSLGLVGFADVAITVEPRYELSVRADWGTDAGDVDLHLVPAGGALFDSSDCYFAHPTRDWGLPGSSADDPMLYADVEAGTGNERILIRRPAAQGYDVWLNYFDSRGDRLANVSVRIAADDATTILATASATLLQTCDSVLLGTLEWPARTFTAAGAAVTSICYAGGE